MVVENLISTPFMADKAPFAEIFVYRDGADRIEEGFSLDELPTLLEDRSNLVWLDLRGEDVNDHKVIEELLIRVFRFHHLTVEDCIETRNQPKVEAFPGYLFFIVHGVTPDKTTPTDFVTKELDGYLGENFVVTFHLERFRSVKEVKTLIRSTPLPCQRGPAFLLHQILDRLVDNYNPVVDEFNEQIELIEDEVLLMQNGESSMLERIMDVRRSVARLKRISTRQREVLYRMSHGEFKQIPENILPFFRDVHDHLLRVTDLSESYRELVSGLVEIHFSVVANRTNEVMKTLAVVSAIILPLSLIAGIYGMNFENIPELRTRYGYFAVLGLMGLLTLALLVYFKRRGWIFQSERARETHADRTNDEE